MWTANWKKPAQPQAPGKAGKEWNKSAGSSAYERSIEETSAHLPETLGTLVMSTRTVARSMPKHTSNKCCTIFTKQGTTASTSRPAPEFTFFCMGNVVCPKIAV